MQITSPWSPVEVRQPITAARDEVFAVISDPRTYPDWLVGAQRIRDVDPDFPEPGAEFDHSVGPTDDVTVDDSTKAIAKQGHRRLVLQVHVGPVTGEVEFLLKSHSAWTEVIMRERPVGPAGVFTPLLRPLLAARNKKSLKQLAVSVENYAFAS